jgi:hypothetical protein
MLTVGAAGPAVLALPRKTPIGAGESRSATNAEVPFELYRDFMIVVQGSAGERHNLNFFIDTGSSQSVVDNRLARKLRLARSPKEISVFGRTVVTEEAILPSLQLGSLLAPRLPVVVKDLSNYRDELEVPVDVIVGIDVLSRTSFTIDYEARKLILGPAERLSNSTPCDTRFPYPTVPLQIGNLRIGVLVDTGAQDLALFERQTRTAFPDVQIVGQETRRVLEGLVIVKRAEFHELTLGTTHWTQREGFFTEAASNLFHGLLGPRWLGAKRISFDPEHKVISWEK